MRITNRTGNFHLDGEDWVGAGGALIYSPSQALRRLPFNVFRRLPFNVYRVACMPFVYPMWEKQTATC